MSFFTTFVLVSATQVLECKPSRVKVRHVGHPPVQTIEVRCKKGDTYFCPDVEDYFPRNKLAVCATKIEIRGIFKDSFEDPPDES